MTSGCVLLLAAGSGNRYGSDKRRARTSSGCSLLSASIALYTALRWPVVVVTRAQELDLQQATLAELRKQQTAPTVHWVSAMDAALGMGHSLRSGVAQVLNLGHTCALIGLADMPYVKPATVLSLQHGLHAAPANAIVRPRYNGQPGNPVGFCGAKLETLLQADGDSGARPLLQQHSSAIVWLDVDDPGIVQDVDQPGDLLPI